MQPTTGQLLLLVLAIAFFVVGGMASAVRLRLDRPGLRRMSLVCLVGGIASALAVLVWHSASRGDWIPLGDNFDALIWLALLLALFVVYIQAVHPLAGLDWFVMPVVILLLLGAGHFGASEYRRYGHNVWTWVHSATAYSGAVAFAVAAATGAMYVLTARRLRRKTRGQAPFGSLERLEHLTMHSVTLGFALLSIGVVTGVIRWVEGTHVAHAKVLLTGLAWLVYAVVLHAPINPRFRGRRAAALSVFGFVLMIATLVAVQFAGRGHG